MYDDAVNIFTRPIRAYSNIAIKVKINNKKKGVITLSKSVKTNSNYAVRMNMLFYQRSIIKINFIYIAEDNANFI